jgi:hypothetical protein
MYVDIGPQGEAFPSQETEGDFKSPMGYSVILGKYTRSDDHGIEEFIRTLYIEAPGALDRSADAVLNLPKNSWIDLQVLGNGGVDILGSMGLLNESEIETYNSQGYIIINVDGEQTLVKGLEFNPMSIDERVFKEVTRVLSLNPYGIPDQKVKSGFRLGYPESIRNYSRYSCQVYSDGFLESIPWTGIKSLFGDVPAVTESYLRERNWKSEAPENYAQLLQGLLSEGYIVDGYILDYSREDGEVFNIEIGEVSNKWIRGECYGINPNLLKLAQQEGFSVSG